MQTVNDEEQVLQFIEVNLNTSTRAIAQQLGISKSVVWWILHDDKDATCVKVLLATAAIGQPEIPNLS